MKHVDELDKAGIRRTPRNTPGASEAWRKASGLDDHERPTADPARGPGQAGFADRVLGDADDVVVTEVRAAASDAVARGESSSRRGGPTIVIDEGGGATLDDEVRAELAKVVPTKERGRIESRLSDAGRAFRRDRYADAARILRQLTKDAPGVPSVHELYGLTLYRQGKWRQAAKELESFRLLTGSSEQHPVLADCYRALGQWATVEGLWDELRAASPGAEVMVEGRIVTAGARADQGDVRGAIDLLEQGWKAPKRPKEHHLRRAYALADLYERGEEVARARQLFEWIDRHDPDFADASRRARLLGA